MSIWTILLSICILIVVLLILAAYYFGVFMKIQAQIKLIGPFKIIYRQIQCNYCDLGQHFAKLYEIKQNENFENCDTMGIYYDNPYAIADPNQCRSSICLIVNNINDDKIQECCKKYENLEFKELPKTKAIATTPFPYRGFLTFFVYPFKIYPKMSEFFKTLPENETKSSCSIEYYPSDPKDPKNFIFIKGYMPLTVEASKYCLTNFPQPDQKGEDKEKKEK